MPLYSKQGVGYSTKITDREPTNDGGQSVIATGYKNRYIFWAWLVPEEDLNKIIEEALPEGYALNGQPTVAEIANIKHYNVRVEGVSWTDQPLEAVVEAPHSGQFY